jgi:Rps23 Pro-64 3,4-dihydroxylase Tpa1-like proline 4-hydroxylase
MINKEIKTREAQFDYLKTGYAQLPNFLDRDYAINLYAHIDTQPHDWWVHASRPNIAGMNEAEYLAPNEENESLIWDAQVSARDAHSKGQFAYHFYRTVDNHVEECTCLECQFREFILTDEFMDIVEKVTGHRCSKVDEMFSSMYTKGDFLNNHTDGNKGKVGFVLNLTLEDWRPHYGGNLVLLDEKENIERVIVPAFNNLVLFDVEGGQGKPHYVGEITHNRAKRLAISGWIY